MKLLFLGGKRMAKHSNFIGLHHGSLIVKNLRQSLDFYCETLGLKRNNQRPEMSFDGAWIDVGEQQIHLLVLPEKEQNSDNSGHAGRDRHLAIHVTQIDIIKVSLKSHNIPFTLSQSGRQALFCRDPDGNGLEFIKVPG